MRLEMLPDPHHDVFRGRIFDDVVKREVIQNVDDFAMNDPFDRIEILDHAARRSFGLDRAADGNVEPVGMSVHPGTFALMVRKHVSRLEAERLAYLH